MHKHRTLEFDVNREVQNWPIAPSDELLNQRILSRPIVSVMCNSLQTFNHSFSPTDSKLQVYYRHCNREKMQM